MATTTYRHPRGAYPAGRTDRAIAGLWSPKRALAVLLLGFALLGLTIGAQAVLWAELMPTFGVSPGVFGSAQLISPLIAIVLLVLGGQLSSQFGKKRMGLASMAMLGAAALVLSAAAGLPGLVLALTHWCEGQPDLVPYRGPCLIHHVELLRLHGDWQDALQEARTACDWLSLPASPERPADAFY